MTMLAIVGASLAGASAAHAAREAGFNGDVVLFGAEQAPPYERPPLSKDYLRGESAAEDTEVFSADRYDELGIDLRTGTRVTGLDVATRRLELSDGETMAADRVLLTPGARPRVPDLPGSGLRGVHLLRSRSDSDRLRGAIAEAEDMVIVGAGWIGCEVAASARAMGTRVTLVEQQAEPLQAVVGMEIGRVLRQVHEEKGVRFISGTGVRSIDGAGDVAGVTLDDGTALSCDVVLIAVGAEPRTELAERAGLEVDDGIVVDAGLRTSAEGVYAAGDVASAWHPHYGRHLRVEHWANARRQGRAAGRALAGAEVEYDRLPYFFSDQYDVGLEYVGDATGADGLVIRGDTSASEFVAFWCAEGAVVAAMTVNVWDAIDDLESIIRSRRRIPAERLADDDTPLADLTSGASTRSG